MWKWQPRVVLLDQFLRDLYISIMLLTNADTSKCSWYNDRFYLWESFQKECCRSTTISRLSKIERRSAIIIIITNLDFCPSIPWNCACVIFFLASSKLWNHLGSTKCFNTWAQIAFSLSVFSSRILFFLFFPFSFPKRAGWYHDTLCQCLDCYIRTGNGGFWCRLCVASFKVFCTFVFPPFRVLQFITWTLPVSFVGHFALPSTWCYFKRTGKTQEVSSSSWCCTKYFLQPLTKYFVDIYSWTHLHIGNTVLT
jgi:hypothetical protein